MICNSSPHKKVHLSSFSLEYPRVLCKCRNFPEPGFWISHRRLYNSPCCIHRRRSIHSSERTIRKLLGRRRLVKVDRFLAIFEVYFGVCFGCRSDFSSLWNGFFGLRFVRIKVRLVRWSIKGSWWIYADQKLKWLVWGLIFKVEGSKFISYKKSDYRAICKTAWNQWSF